jgi:segregation and condensation protein A
VSESFEDKKIVLSRPPLNVLLNPEGNRVSKPWEVDLATLLETFLNLITKMEFLDLRLCGSAALSSALIYRMKVETLFLLDKIKQSRRANLEFSGEAPLLLEMPFRQEVYSTSIEDLVSTLEKILEEIIHGRRKQSEQRNMVALEPVITFDPNEFLVKISELVDSFRIQVLTKIRQAGQFLFSDYCEGKDSFEKAQCFIFFLFLAMEGTVLLEQTESDDILVSGVPVTTV